MNYRLRRAERQGLEPVNGLIARAKSGWGYPEDYLRVALPLLRVDEDYLFANLCFEIERDATLCGFVAVTEVEGEKYLDHLWIDPVAQNQGAGRFALFRRSFDRTSHGLVEDSCRSVGEPGETT